MSGSVDLHKVDPDGAGLDASRLERITRHLSEEYIDAGASRAARSRSHATGASATSVRSA